MSDTMAGMHWMLVTPFDDEENVDLDSISNLVEHAIKAGCVGVVTLGEMGEWRRLSDKERTLILDRTMESVNGRVHVTVGATAPSTHLAIVRSREAQQFGATTIMVSPPPLPKPNPDVVRDYYRHISDAVDIPLVIQDFPQTSGVHMSPQFIANLFDVLPSFKYLKLEDPPTPTKITRIRDLTGSKMGIFGGLGGNFLLDELNRGGIGAMTGFAYPEILVEIIRLWFKGHQAEATSLFNRFLPLILFENQEGINLSIRKAAIKGRGLLNTARVRHPGGPVDDKIHNELVTLIENLNPENLEVRIGAE
ncbi:dihydrodipicolinate synthase family protein [SAR202 cluster bacterium AD-804-J14_MRT_500m]|nr:dihydrodipicolinate synthase family protein [SAR202 cluster bacterium AD-804-J14_MRT_500m]